MTTVPKNPGFVRIHDTSTVRIQNDGHITCGMDIQDYVPPSGNNLASDHHGDTHVGGRW